MNCRRQCLRRCQDSMPSLQPLYPRQLRCQRRQASKPLLRLRRCRDSMPSLQPLHPRQLRCQRRQASKPTLQRRVQQSTYQDLRLRRISFEWWSFGRLFFEWSSQWMLFFGQQSTLPPYESLSCVQFGASAFPLPPAPPPRAQVFLLLMRQWTIRRNRCHQMKRQ